MLNQALPGHQLGQRLQTTSTTMPPPLPSTTVNAIISYIQQGLTIKDIRAKTGVSRSQISKIGSAHCPEVPRAKGGRPSLLSPTDIRRATRLIETGQADTATEVYHAIKDTFLGTVSVQTIRRALKRQGMLAVTKKKRPYLSPRHKAKRYAFALSKKYWTVEDWKRVVWSDETKINRVGSDGRKWVWKKQGEGLSDRLVEGTLKHGRGSLMFWGCFGWKGTGHSCKIDGKMDADLYVEIIEDELINSLYHWDYSIDDFAWHDIPDSIEYILKVTKEPSLSYVGFSQGTAQAFAALSIHPPLNEKVNVFVALAPAMSPAGLAARVVDGLMKARYVGLLRVP